MPVDYITYTFITKTNVFYMMQYVAKTCIIVSVFVEQLVSLQYIL